jgi:hypothetical protein
MRRGGGVRLHPDSPPPFPPAPGRAYGDNAPLPPTPFFPPPLHPTWTYTRGKGEGGEGLGEQEGGIQGVSDAIAG